MIQVEIRWPINPFRGDKFAAGWLPAAEAVLDFGATQWSFELPSELVWLHVALATTTWLAMLWTVATAGRLEPKNAPSTTDTHASPRRRAAAAPKSPQPAA